MTMSVAQRSIGNSRVSMLQRQHARDRTARAPCDLGVDLDFVAPILEHARHATERNGLHEDAQIAGLQEFDIGMLEKDVNIFLEHPDIEFLKPCNLCIFMKSITLGGVARVLEDGCN